MNEGKESEEGQEDLAATKEAQDYADALSTNTKILLNQNLLT